MCRGPGGSRMWQKSCGVVWGQVEMAWGWQVCCGVTQHQTGAVFWGRGKGMAFRHSYIPGGYHVIP